MQYMTEFARGVGTAEEGRDLPRSGRLAGPAEGLRLKDRDVVQTGCEMTGKFTVITKVADRYKVSIVI
jgi:hypothetical protein